MGERTYVVRMRMRMDDIRFERVIERIAFAELGFVRSR
jgi:hypothetical protein